MILFITILKLLKEIMYDVANKALFKYIIQTVKNYAPF